MPRYLSVTPAQTLRYLGEGGGCSQFSREGVGSGRASEWKNETHGRSAREKSFTGHPAANSSMDEGLEVEQRSQVFRNPGLIDHRGATPRKLLGALEAASREPGGAPSRAALSSSNLRNAVFGPDESLKSGRPTLHLVCRLREGAQRQEQPARERPVVWRQTDAFAGIISQGTMNHKEEAEPLESGESPNASRGV